MPKIESEAVEFIDQMIENHRGIVASMNFIAAQSEVFQDDLEAGSRKLSGRKPSKNDDFLSRKD